MQTATPPYTLGCASSGHMIDCIPMSKAQPEGWSCPHCGNTYHFPKCCLFRIGTSSNPPNRQLPSIGAIANTPKFSLSATFSTPNPQSLPALYRDFNFRGCPQANCTYHHACEQCAGPHLEHNCPWGSLLPTLGKWSVCTPLRPLILECELTDHPDKAFVKLLLSDITQGCNIGYTSPQFASHCMQFAIIFRTSIHFG